METLYENVKHDDLNMPATVSFTAEKAEKIVSLLKDANVKCIVNSDENKTDITFSIDDIEKLNKILQPIGIEKQLNNSAIQLHNIEKKEDLIPIANTFSKLYDRKINGKNSCIEAHQKHIGTLSNALNQQKSSIQALKDRNIMLAKFSEIFTAFKNPINALITRNEKKIDRLINNNIPKLEKQIQAHHTTIDKLNKSAEHYMVKQNACKHLSEVIKSFVISSKNERNQNYLTALSSLNGDIQQINNDRIKNCINTIEKLETNFSELPLIKQQKVQERISNLIKTQNRLAERNKVLQAAQPDISAMIARLNDNSVTEKIDMAAIMFDQKIAKNSNMYFDSVMTSTAVENSCAVSPTAAEIVQTEVNVISNVNDKDGDMIPDRLDSTFDPKAAANNESQDVKEQQNPVSDIQENNSQDVKEIQYDAMLNEYRSHKTEQAYEEIISVLTANNYFKDTDQIPLSIIGDIREFADKQAEFNPTSVSPVLELNKSFKRLYNDVMAEIMNNNISSLNQIQTALGFISIIDNNLQQMMNVNINTVDQFMSELTDTDINFEHLQGIDHFSGEVLEINDNVKQIINNNISTLDKIQIYLNDNSHLGNDAQYTNKLAQIQDKLSSLSAENNNIQQKANDVDKAMQQVFELHNIVSKQKGENTLFYHLSSEEFNTLKNSGIKYEGDERYKITDEIDYGKILICINIKDKNKFAEILPDLKPENTQAQEMNNNKSQAVQEQQNPVSDIQENQSENSQAQEIPNVYDNSFDEMLEENKDHIPPLYDDYMPEPPDYAAESQPYTPQKTDTRIYLVTENELESLKKSGIKLKASDKDIQEDGKIPILINAKDKGKYKKIINDLKKSNENKVVNKK